ncbi:MAG: phosphatidylserine/phosphatidylglycerophosphate/cardiolipin synthase family protein [Chlamydiales bacterium]
MYLLSLIILLFTFNLAKADEDNAVIVCKNSLETVEWDLEFIRHAHHSIDFAPCFFGGEIARKFLAAIESRLEVCPDLQVHVLTSPVFFEKEDFEIFDYLKKTYPENFHFEYAANVIIVWPDIGGINNHVKLCVIDESYFSIGGTNFDTTHCADGTFTPEREFEKLNIFAKLGPAGTRDQDIVGRGPIAIEIRQTLCKLFALWHHYNMTNDFEINIDRFEKNPFYFEVLEKPFIEKFEESKEKIFLEKDRMEYLFSGPYQFCNPITQSYTRLIREAKKEIKIANLYMNPVDAILEALLESVNRGVKLTIITNGLSENAPNYNSYFAWANRLSYLPLFFGEKFNFWSSNLVKNMAPKDTRIYEYHVKDILLHKKVMIVDNAIVVIGSYNLGTKSHCSDYETVMVIHSPKVASMFEEIYQIDKEKSREIHPEEAIDWYFNPLISYIGHLQKSFSGFL